MKINTTQSQPMLHNFLFEPNIYISLVVTLKGDLDEKNIESAIKIAYTQNETTMSKILLEDGMAYFKAIDESGCKVMTDTRDWREIMHESEKDAFKINEGEFIRSYIIPRDGNFELFIMAHHIVGDGNALILFLQDILNNLAGKKVEYRALLNNEAVSDIPKEAKFPLLSKLGLSLLNKQWKKTGKTFIWKDYFDIHEQFWKDRQTDIQIEVIEKEELNHIKAASKQMGITVNSYIFAQVLSRMPAGKSISFPFSMRGTNRSMSNQITTIKFPFTYDKGLSLEENAKRVHKEIREHFENKDKRFHIALATSHVSPTLMDGALMLAYTGYKNDAAEKIAQRWGYVGNDKSDLGLTNLKEIELETEYGGFSVVDIIVVAATMSSTKTVVCASTLKDRMTLCYTNIK